MTRSISSKKKIVPHFPRTKKDFGDVLINVYLWIMFSTVFLLLFSFCFKILWILLYFYNFLLQRVILNSYRCIFVLMQISYSSAIPGRFSPQNSTWCCFNIITLRHLVIRYLITVLYLLYGSDFEKKIQEKVIKVIERHISSWSFMKHYIILYSKLKPSKDSIHLFVS